MKDEKHDSVPTAIRDGTAAKEQDCLRVLPEWFDGKRINEAVFSEMFLQEHPMKCIHGHLFDVDGVVTDLNRIRSTILKMISRCTVTGLSPKVSNLLECIKMYAYAEPLPLETDRIHVANGIYYLDGSFELRKVYCNNRLTVPYDPAAPEPVQWKQFLADLLYPEDIATLQEYLGYLLIPTTKAQKMLMLVGKGGEGKSRIGLVMRSILGDAMNDGNLQKLELNQFARSDLEFKLAMVDDDMAMNALPKTNYIKSIVTAEGKLDLERKGKQSYQGFLYARLLCFGNGVLASSSDRSNGFYRRQLVLSTKDRPQFRQDDPFLAEKMIAEKEGIFLWCIDGLKRLIANNYQFTVSQRSLDMLEKMQTESKQSDATVPGFIQSEGYIVFNPERGIITKRLYEIYRQWCFDNAYQPLGESTFSSNMMEQTKAFGVTSDNNFYLENRRRVRGFRGIGEMK